MDERLDLKAYPMPPSAKRLMPFQDQPFNGDGYLAAEVLRLARLHGCRTFFETGTCYGSTTLWAAEHFEDVWTVEVSPEYREVAVKRFVEQAVHGKVITLEGSSPEVIQGIHKDTMRLAPIIFWLDAHWRDQCPLIREIEAISDKGIRPVIVIHDFKVPGRPDLGFDCFPGGEPFELSKISASLDRVYGPDGWTHHFNDRAEGAKRGVVFIEPAQPA